MKLKWKGICKQLFIAISPPPSTLIQYEFGYPTRPLARGYVFVMIFNHVLQIEVLLCREHSNVPFDSRASQNFDLGRERYDTFQQSIIATITLKTELRLCADTKKNLSRAAERWTARVRVLLSITSDPSTPLTPPTPLSSIITRTITSACIFFTAGISGEGGGGRSCSRVNDVLQSLTCKYNNFGLKILKFPLLEII